jgi:hypothetical protein
MNEFRDKEFTQRLHENMKKWRYDHWLLQIKLNEVDRLIGRWELRCPHEDQDNSGFCGICGKLLEKGVENVSNGRT